jgi:hypothetical protein
MTNREISTATRERLFVGRFLIECPGRLGFFDHEDVMYRWLCRILSLKAMEITTVCFSMIR